MKKIITESHWDGRFEILRRLNRQSVVLAAPNVLGGKINIAFWKYLRAAFGLTQIAIKVLTFLASFLAVSSCFRESKLNERPLVIFQVELLAFENN